MARERREIDWLLSVVAIAMSASCAMPEMMLPRSDARVDARADVVTPDVRPQPMDGEAPCPGGDTRCSGVCTSVLSDPMNCGACGTQCSPGEVCAMGRCGPATPMCPAGQMSCGGVCVDTQTDLNNCGACGRMCAAGQTCAAGMCMGMAMCPAGQTRCGAACASLDSDPMNCGACGTACAAGQSCTMARCVSARMMCAAGQTDCAPTAPSPMCVDVQSSSAHCGACGNACSAGQSCSAGVCACAAGTTLCGRSCVNTQTDAMNCGGCGSACPMGQVCAAGRCACPAGQLLCGGVCVNTQTDSANCGACAMACPMDQVCAAGRCACMTGQVLCGMPSACVSLQTDRNNCGACGTVCPMGQVCAAGRCACPMGQMACGTPALCVDTQTSSAHCGACNNACGPGTGCMAGMCRGIPPANDTRAGAVMLDLSMPSQTIAVNTMVARNDTTGPCGCTSGNDVFYRFTLTQPEIVMADTFGAAWDTSLFFQSSTGGSVTAGTGFTTCSDDSTECGNVGRQSAIFASLPAGTYFLVLSGCGAGAATIRFQHVPAGAGAATRITPTTTARTATGTTGATSGYSGSCCSSGGDAALWWLTCPNTATAPFYASTCNPMTGANRAGYNSSLSQHSASRAMAACNDDVGLVCGNGSTVTSTIPATSANQLSLNSLVIDGCMAMGSYSVDYSLGACASGTRCGSACVDTASDVNHCGGCDRRCSAGQSCRMGMCSDVPLNDQPAGAIAINMANPQSTFTVNTMAAGNDTTGSCGCTSGNDVFYTFTVAAGRSELVYADTIGSNYDTSIFFQSSTGTNITTANLGAQGAVCNDDGGLAGCGTLRQSQVMARFEAGTYRLVVSGCGSGGMATIRFQHVPIGNGPLSFLPMGSTPIATTSTSGTGRVTSTCSSAGPENTYYWYTCPAFAAAMFSANTCGRASWDTSLAQSSPGRATPIVCNDDSCGTQSQITATIPAGAGIHALYVDGFSSTSSGSYTVAVTRP